MNFRFPILVALLFAYGEHLIAQEPAQEGRKASFSMNISLTSATVKPGDEVQVIVSLTNTSKEGISLWRARRGPPLYSIEVLDRAGKPAPLTPLGIAFRRGDLVIREQGKPQRIIPGGSGAFAAIAPGETAKDVFLLSQQVDLSQPGEYMIQLVRADPATKVLVKSNAVTLKVESDPPVPK